MSFLQRTTGRGRSIRPASRNDAASAHNKREDMVGDVVLEFTPRTAHRIGERNLNVPNMVARRGV
jgi:hypothetical protein